MTRFARSLALVLSFLVVISGCTPAPDDVAEIADMGPAIAEPPILDELDTWPTVEDLGDLAQLEEMRDGWGAAFESGDAAALDFVFARDAVMTDLASLVGEDAARPDAFFSQYDAEFSITNDNPKKLMNPMETEIRVAIQILLSRIIPNGYSMTQIR